MNKTKIVATISPINSSKEMIKSLILNGVDVIRFNMNYASPDFCRETIAKINEANKELNTYVATMMDIKGPLIRIGKIVNDGVFLKSNDKIRIFMDDIIGDCTKFSVDYKGLVNEAPLNTILRTSDGNVELQVIDKGIDYLLCKVLKEGIIYSNKSINVLDVKLNKPFLSEEDKKMIKFSHELGIDFLALSYIKTQEDVLEVNDLLIDLGDDNIQIISKIENNSALEDIDNIIKVSDGILLARENLSVEISMERIPGIQKKIISKCHESGVISIVAIELSTTKEVVRSEVSDIANAVLDGTDAVMIGGEVSINNSIEALKLLERVIKSSEKDINYNYFIERAARTEKKDTTGSIAYSVAGCSNRLQCKAIFTPTMSGYTAKKISRFRPICPIVAVSPNINTVKSLMLNFGVCPILIDDLRSLDSIIERSKEIAKEILLLEKNDTIIITGGYPFKKVNHTNFMKIEQI